MKIFCEKHQGFFLSSEGCNYCEHKSEPDLPQVRGSDLEDVLAFIKAGIEKLKTEPAVKPNPDIEDTHAGQPYSRTVRSYEEVRLADEQVLVSRPDLKVFSFSDIVRHETIPPEFKDYGHWAPGNILSSAGISADLLAPTKWEHSHYIMLHGYIRKIKLTEPI